MKETLTDWLRDTVKAGLAGIGTAAGLFAVFFLAGLLLNSFDWKAALMLGRSGLFFVGALALFVLAGLLLKKEGGKGIRKRGGWNKHFRVFGLTQVVLIIAVMILAAAVILDYGIYGRI